MRLFTNIQSNIQCHIYNYSVDKMRFLIRVSLSLRAKNFIVYHFIFVTEKRTLWKKWKSLYFFNFHGQLYKICLDNLGQIIGGLFQVLAQYLFTKRNGNGNGTRLLSLESECTSCLTSC